MGDINDDIKRYREGSMTGRERNALEKRALSDPFLADALEGSEVASPEDFASDVSAISRRIKRDGDISWFTPLRIAAGVLLVIGAGSLFYWINQPEPELLASKEAAPPVDTLMSKVDSTTSTLLALEEAKPADEQPTKASAPKVNKSAGTLDQGKSAEADAKSTKADAQPVMEPTLAQGREAEEKDEVAKDKVADDNIAQVEVEARELNEEAADLRKKAASGAGAQKLEEQRARALSSRGEDKTISSRFYQANAQNISGQVTAKEDGSPLPGVNVVVKGTTQGTVTDDQGNYSLPSQGENPTLEFSFIGMKTVDVKVKNLSQNNVQMTEDATQLSEVVVTGMNLKENALTGTYEPLVKLASPKGGMRAYNKYLEKSLRFPPEALEKKVKGKVMIGFTVTTEGELIDFNVIKSLGYGCDEEVIRLIKEGPTWSPSTQDDVAVDSEVKVRLKFDSEKAGK